MACRRTPAQPRSTDDVYNTWKVRWDSDTSQAGLGEDVKFFQEQYARAYWESVRKRDKNKRRNTWVKVLFTCVLLVGAVFQTALLSVAAKVLLCDVPSPDVSEVSAVDFTALDAMLLLTVLAVLLAISKWEAVRKHQETWARHTLTVSLYDQAMLLYLLGQPMDALPFPGLASVDFPASLSRQQAFWLRILQIMGNNQERFAVNLGEKEARLMEDLSSLVR